MRELSKTGGALHTASPHSTLKNPRWFRAQSGAPTAERRELHARLRAEILDGYPASRNEARALVLAGPPGAGKGSAARKVLGEELAAFVNIDADEFKKLLLREAIADGSYETWLIPEPIRELEHQGERFYPLELASLVHEESSRLAAALRADLITAETNIVVDTVLGSTASAEALGRQLDEGGYSVTLVDVEVPYAVSEHRIVRRWRRAMRDAELGSPGALGGRWVPSAYVRPLFDTEHGRSRSQDAAERLARSCPAVLRYERYFTSLEEHEASLAERRDAVLSLEAALSRRHPGDALHDLSPATGHDTTPFASPARQTTWASDATSTNPSWPTM